MTAAPHPRVAAFLCVEASCPDGCIVLRLCDERDRMPIAEGHLAPDRLEDFIAELRRVAAEQAARQRSVA